MGDALMRARRPADALRVYQRAAALAPHTPGIDAKIQRAQAAPAKAKPARVPAPEASGSADAGKRFSNSDPETQTH
jgi:hypothetical protein